MLVGAVRVMDVAAACVAVSLLTKVGTGTAGVTLLLEALYALGP